MVLLSTSSACLEKKHKMMNTFNVFDRTLLRDDYYQLQHRIIIPYRTMGRRNFDIISWKSYLQSISLFHCYNCLLLFNNYFLLFNNWLKLKQPNNIITWRHKILNVVLFHWSYMMDDYFSYHSSIIKVPCIESWLYWSFQHGGDTAWNHKLNVFKTPQVPPCNKMRLS